MKFFHEPIGTPLGEGHAPVKEVSRTEKRASVRKITAAQAAKREAQQPKFNEDKMGPRDIVDYRNDPIVSAIREKALTLYKGPASDITPAQTTTMVREFRGDDVTGNLWQLDAKRLTDAINSPNIDPDRLRALKVEKAKRIAVAQRILGSKAGVKEVIKKAGNNPTKITRAINTHAPKPIVKVWASLAARGMKFKDADHAQSIVDSIWDFAVKAVLGTAGALLAIHTGMTLSNEVDKVQLVDLAMSSPRDDIRSTHPVGCSRGYHGKTVKVVGHSGDRVKIDHADFEKPKTVSASALEMTKTVKTA